jgi:N-acetylglutamate synthase/N-acetylornithine aminotransferase
VHATIRNYSGAAALADALVEHQDDIRNLLTGIDGFRAYYIVRDGDGATTISVFDDQAGADESTRLAAEWIAENLGDLGVAPPEVTSGPVIFSI